jgi:hypothetical protein
MSGIRRIITLAAIAAATAAADPGIAGAVPIGPVTPSGGTTNPYLTAAKHAAAGRTAPLGRFTLIHVHMITPVPTSVVSGNADPEGFQIGDAAIAAGAMAGFVVLGTAGAITVRRRAHVWHA